MWICIAHRREHAYNASFTRPWSPLPSLQPDTSLHCKTTNTGYCITSRARLIPPSVCWALTASTSQGMAHAA